MADERFTPRDNLYRFIPRATHGRGRVGVRLTGVGIPENPPVSRETKEQLINFHISSINAMLRAQGRPELSPADYAKVHAAAQLSPNQSSESILQTVLSAATTVAPTTNAQDAFKKFLADNQITAEQFNAAQLRLGNVGYQALIDAARSMRGGSEPSGNMSNGVGNNNSYVSSPSSVTMSNYMSTPYAGTGMTHSTFTYLRDTLRAERFSGQNILHAGQDTRRHGFNPNDRPVARDFAIIDRDDGARRNQMHAVYERFNNELANDADIQRLKREGEQAATPEAKKVIEDQLRAKTDEIARRSGMTGHIAGAPTPAARAAHERNRDRFIQRHTGLHAEHRAEIGDDAARGLTDEQIRATTNRADPTVIVRSGVRLGAPTNNAADADLLAAATPRPAATPRDAAAVITAGERLAARTNEAADADLLAAATRRDAPPTTVVAGIKEDKKPEVAATPAVTPTVKADAPKPETGKTPVQTAAAKPVIAPKIG